MAMRWLLLLGSNLADDSRVREALQGLAQLGAMRACAPIQRMRAYDGNGTYFNVLAQLDCDLSQTQLQAALKQLEQSLGRQRNAKPAVAIDIDILAQHDGACWHADTHALAKGEFTHSAVQTLLTQAGIDIATGGCVDDTP